MKSRNAKLIVLAFLITIIQSMFGLQCWQIGDGFKLEIDEECIKIFPNQVNDNISRTGYTLLHWACEKGQTDIVEYLIRQGANVNTSDDFGVTPLHVVAKNHEMKTPDELAKIAIMLLEHGADINAKTMTNKTPIDLAQEYDNPYLVQFFEQWMLGIEPKTAEISTPPNYYITGLDIVQNFQTIARYDIEGEVAEIYRDPEQTVDDRTGQYPFLVIHRNSELIDCSNASDNTFINKTAWIYYYNNVHSQGRDKALCPVTPSPYKSSNDDNYYPTLDDLESILGDVKQIAFMGDINNLKAFKGSIQSAMYDSSLSLFSQGRAEARDIGAVMSDIMMNEYVQSPVSFKNILEYHWRNKLRTQYKKLRNPKLPQLYSYKDTYEKMFEIYEILSLEPITLALERLHETQKTETVSTLADDEFRLAFQNALQISIINMYGNTVTKDSLEFIVENFLDLPMVEKTLINFYTNEDYQPIDLKAVRMWDEENLQGVVRSICAATDKANFLEAVESPYQENMPYREFKEFDVSEVEPSRITVKVNNVNQAGDIADGAKNTSQKYKFIPEAPYVVPVDPEESDVEVSVEYDRFSTEKDGWERNIAYPDSIRKDELKREQDNIGIYPKFYDLGEIEPFGNIASMKISVRNNQKLIRVLERVNTPRDVYLVSPIPPYSVPPGGSFDIVLEFDPFNYAGRSITRDVDILFNNGEKHTVTFQVKVKKAYRGLMIEPEEIFLDSLDPYAGLVTLMTTVYNNDKKPRTLEKVGLINGLELASPRTPYTIGPNSKVDVLVELDPSYYQGQQIRKGFTLVFDESEMHNVTFDAVVGEYTGQIEISQYDFDLGFLDPNDGPVKIQMKLYNHETEYRTIVGINSIYDLYLVSPELPFVIPPDEEIDFIVEFDPANYIGRPVNGMFQIRFDKGESQKVSFKCKVEEIARELSIRPDEIDIGTVEARGGRIQMRTKIWNNTETIYNLYAVDTPKDVYFVHPDLPYTIPPHASCDALIEFDPYEHSGKKVQKGFTFMFDNGQRNRVSFKGMVIDNIKYDYPKLEEEKHYVDNLNILINMDESWSNVDLRHPVGVLIRKGASVSLAETASNDKALILTHKDIPMLDREARWVIEKLMTSIAQPIPDIEVQFISKEALGKTDIVIFLPKYSEF